MPDAAKAIALDFSGYFLKRKSLPDASGVYCVYTCVDKDHKTVDIGKLVYIGESDNVRARVTNHELFDAWKSQRGTGRGALLLRSLASPGIDETASRGCHDLSSQASGE